MNEERVTNHFDDADQFETILEEAETKAHRDADVKFVDELTIKFAKYGENMFLSEAQADWLKRIAGV